MGQDIFDLIIVLALVFFAGRGFVRGFVGEVAGVVSLVGGFWAAHAYHSLLSPRLTAIADPAWRTIAAYVLIFLAVILVVAVLARLLQKILSFSFVSWADRLAGGLLGLAKGVLLCALAEGVYSGIGDGATVDVVSLVGALAITAVAVADVLMQV